ncbi:heavy metal-associated isoprenylated plant protein 7-like isoform X2 [Henckelia pumila]|uniref:heavy metal-associated isoprenylated plant protein 7-like isoform X2 n=1 Tax=Henckelia pumila TaxID=405737 RepID=UPI003C6E75BE
MGEEDKKSKEAEKPAAHDEEKKPVESAKVEQQQQQEIILKVYMLCEGCAKKVRRCLKGFEGVEEVKTDYRTSKVVVKGEKADPLKVLERIKNKYCSHRQVLELISPIIPNKPQEKELEVIIIKSEEKKEEQAPDHHVITVVLGVYMHCEACAQEIKKRIQRMKGGIHLSFFSFWL